MKYKELSTESVKTECKKLYGRIKKEYPYDLVIFVAKGAFIIGEEFAKQNKVPLLEIVAKRKGGTIKNMLKPFLRIIPKGITMKLREEEMNSEFHEKRKERSVSFNKEKYEEYKTAKKILIIDDSIDSGNTINSVMKTINDFFGANSEKRILAFNVMSKSTIKPNYTIYMDTLVKGPWSSDSLENPEFIRKYKKWRKDNA